MAMLKRPLRSYFRPHLESINPYHPVQPPEALARRLGLQTAEVSKLDANENPYGPSPLALEALRSVDSIHRYPDPLAADLREAVAAYAGVRSSMVLIGAGADELLELIVRLFVDPGDATVDAPPTFSMYSAFTLQNGGAVRAVPRCDDWSLDLDGMLDAVPGANLVWTASPNNPTGNLLDELSLRALLGTGAPVVLDEAYYEFSGRTFADLLGEFENLIILRTFSKLAGLAGLRVGYMLARETVVSEALKIKQPYNVSVASQAAALASLQDLPRLSANVRRLVEERERMMELLRAEGSLRPFPSSANFVLCRVSRGSAPEVLAALARRGVFVRHFDQPRIEDCLRISVGRSEDTDRLVAALTDISGGAAGRW